MSPLWTESLLSVRPVNEDLFSLEQSKTNAAVGVGEVRHFGE